MEFENTSVMVIEVGDEEGAAQVPVGGVVTGEVGNVDYLEPESESGEWAEGFAPSVAESGWYAASSESSPVSEMVLRTIESSYTLQDIDEDKFLYFVAWVTAKDSEDRFYEQEFRSSDAVTLLKTGALKVTVGDEGGGVLEEATVKVSQSGGYSTESTTGRNGIVDFGTVPVGVYSVEVSLEGYETQRREAVTVEKGGLTEITVKLVADVPEPDPDPEPEPDPEPDPEEPVAPVIPDDVAHSGAVTTPDEVPAGSKINVFVGTAHAGTTVDLWMFSAPSYLGKYTVNAQGYATGVQLPANVTGTHRIVAVDASGTVIGWDTRRITGLAVTGAGGAGTGLGLGAAALLLVGGLLLVARRHRQAA